MRRKQQVGARGPKPVARPAFLRSSAARGRAPLRRPLATLCVSQAFGRDHPIGSLSTFAAIRQIIQTEGHLGLFRGISLNLIKNPAATAVSFVINDAVKDACGYGVL